MYFYNHGGKLNIVEKPFFAVNTIDIVDKYRKIVSNFNIKIFTVCSKKRSKTIFFYINTNILYFYTIFEKNDNIVIVTKIIFVFTTSMDTTAGLIVGNFRQNVIPSKLL